MPGVPLLYLTRPPPSAARVVVDDAFAVRAVRRTPYTSAMNRIASSTHCHSPSPNMCAGSGPICTIVERVAAVVLVRLRSADLHAEVARAERVRSSSSDRCRTRGRSTTTATRSPGVDAPRSGPRPGGRTSSRANADRRQRSTRMRSSRAERKVLGKRASEVVIGNNARRSYRQPAPRRSAGSSSVDHDRGPESFAAGARTLTCSARYALGGVPRKRVASPGTDSDGASGQLGVEVCRLTMRRSGAGAPCSSSRSSPASSAKRTSSRAGVPVELLVDVRAVGLDRAQARADELRDLGVGVPEREQPQDVGLLRRQSADGRARERPRRGRDANAIPIDGWR